MSDPAPPPQDAYLAELERDNKQDDDRARELIAQLDHDSRQRMVLIAQSAAYARERNERVVEALAAGPGMGDREAAVCILAGMATSIKAENEEGILLRRMGLLNKHWPVAPAAPAPVPPAPAPAPGLQQPPAELSDEHAPWYLAAVTPEFIAAGREVSIASAKAHWREFGRRQGRKWAPDSPGWGPSAADAPPGAQL